MRTFPFLNSTQKIKKCENHNQVRSLCSFFLLFLEGVGVKVEAGACGEGLHAYLLLSFLHFYISALCTFLRKKIKWKSFNTNTNCFLCGLFHKLGRTHLQIIKKLIKSQKVKMKMLINGGRAQRDEQVAMLLLMKLWLRYYLVVSEGGGFAGPKPRVLTKRRCALSETNFKLAQDKQTVNRNTLSRFPVNESHIYPFYFPSLHLIQSFLFLCSLFALNLMRVKVSAASLLVSEIFVNLSERRLLGLG